MKIISPIIVPVTIFTPKDEVAQRINQVVADQNVKAIFYNRDSFFKGHYEILVDEPKVITHEVIKEIEKVVEKEVPLKVVQITKKQPGATSQYRGVFKRNNRWIAGIYANGKKRQLGSFTSELAAAEAYDKAAKELHGDRAILNFSEKVGN